MKRKKEIILIIVLAVLLVVAAGYIVITKYTETKQRQQITIYQQGMQVGYQQAVQQLVQQAVTCQQVPVTFQDQTINLIAVECLQQP